jgi:hypothetical protein
VTVTSAHQACRRRNCPGISERQHELRIEADTHWPQPDADDLADASSASLMFTHAG